MNNFIPNSNPNLWAIRHASDGSLILAPIIYWIDIKLQRIPVDLTRFAIDWRHLLDADFAVYDDNSGCVFLRNGDIFGTLDAFKAASQ